MKSGNAKDLSPLGMLLDQASLRTVVGVTSMGDGVFLLLGSWVCMKARKIQLGIDNGKSMTQPQWGRTRQEQCG